jgi:hypothetical protein
VRKWVEEQSWKTDYLCLRVPGLVRLESLTSVENHFRDIHKRSVEQSVKSHRFRCDGATLSLSNPGLVGLVRAGLEEEERCTLEITAALEEHFASLGLQFFDAAWGGLHVAAALPSYLDVTRAGLSEGVRRIIGYVQANPGCTRRQVMEFLVGSPAPSNGQNAEELAVAQDFQWLLHHGCIIEFGNGSLETARPCRSP